MTVQRESDGMCPRSQVRSRIWVAAAVTTRKRPSASRVTVRSASTVPRSLSHWQGPVVPAQRGARHDGRLATALLCGHPVADDLQPRPAVLVGQRGAAAHLRDVGLGMQGVALGELPSEGGGQALRHRRLPTPGDTHDDHDFRVRDPGLTIAVDHPTNVAPSRAPMVLAPRRVAGARRPRQRRARRRRLRRQAPAGQGLGVDGMTLLHPARWRCATRPFAPSEVEVEEALDVLAACEAGAGAEVVTRGGRWRTFTSRPHSGCWRPPRRSRR